MVDPIPTANRILEFLSKLSPFLWLVVGGLVTQLWNRFRTRTRRFVWKAWHQPIAIASNFPQAGTITVQYNGQSVNHVHVTSVEIVNDSNEDQRDVVVTLSFQGVGHIAESTGYIEGTLATFPFDPTYSALYVGATPQQVAVLNTYVVHKIPVFNRRQKAIFNLLVVRDDASTPVVQASCNHPGFKFECASNEPQFHGVSLKLAAIAGFLMSGALLALMMYYSKNRHPYSTAIVAWVLGLSSALIGAETARVWKAFVKILG